MHDDVIKLLDQATSEAVEDSGRHATNLELFLDLVFVFAVTQVAGCWRPT